MKCRRGASRFALLVGPVLIVISCGTPPGPISLTYSSNAPNYLKGADIVTNTPVNYGGIIGSYTITPSLPLGLTFDNTQGNIAGTPNSTTPAGTTSYSITGTSSGGSIITLLPITISNSWYWYGGANTSLGAASYGSLGIANFANVPGARTLSASWTDTSNNFWLFGGQFTAGSVDLNDLWKFDGTNWNWVGGSNSTNQSGTYGSLGVPASGNIPGARDSAAYGTDRAGNFWLFGGVGLDSSGGASYALLNDLWKFNGTNWVWVSGSHLAGQSATYGSKGVTSSSNIPGARSNSTAWLDATGNFWLFGGSTASGSLSDLWKFDGTNWTWINGSNATASLGTYGTLGVASGLNAPGARSASVGWVDSQNNLWLFGGVGADSASATNAPLNDLWKFDGTNWTWISGSNLQNQVANYGTLNAAASTNVPGARSKATAWMDAKGKFWLFGGAGYDTATLGNLNDLWKFDGTNWIWFSGNNQVGQPGIYSNLYTPGFTNTPGSRSGASSWIDHNGNLWTFGGLGVDSVGTVGVLNDLFQFNSVN